MPKINFVYGPDYSVICGNIRIVRHQKKDGWIFPGGKFEPSLEKTIELANRLSEKY